MGRSKMPLKFIEEQGRRSTAYKKRIAGLKKKAKELAILCDVPVLVISFGPQGQVETWPEDNQAVGYIIERYQELNTEIRSKNELDSLGYMKAQVNKHQASFNRRLRNLTDMPLLPSDELLYSMHNSLRELAYKLDSTMEAIKERIQFLQDREHFNGGETMNMAGQSLQMVSADWMTGIQNSGSGYDLMVSDPYLGMGTSSQYLPQPMSFGGGQISTDAIVQYPFLPISMDEAPLAMMPSVPMNMNEAPLAMMPSIPTSYVPQLVGPILEYDSANRDVVPVSSSIGLFENHNLMEGGGALNNLTNFMMPQNSVHGSWPLLGIHRRSDDSCF